MAATPGAATTPGTARTQVEQVDPRQRSRSPVRLPPGAVPPSPGFAAGPIPGHQIVPSAGVMLPSPQTVPAPGTQLNLVGQPMVLLGPGSVSSMPPQTSAPGSVSSMPPQTSPLRGMA